MLELAESPVHTPVISAAPTPAGESTAVPQPPVASGGKTVIEPGRRDRQYWTDLWRYRELLFLLAWRDVSVRYKQTVIGIAWAVIRPLLTAAILVAVFGKIARLPSGDLPYPLLVLSGMLAWQLFSSGLAASGDSLVGNANLISKVYFPRLVIPLSSLGVSVVDLVVTLPFVFVLMAWYGTELTWRLAFFPVFLLLTVFAAIGAGLWLSALNVRYRDFRLIVPFVLQFGVYLSPVGFTLAAVPEAYRPWFSLNPLVGMIEGFRWSLLGNAEGFTPLSIGVSVLVTFLTVVTGYRYFRNTERTFADHI